MIDVHRPTSLGDGPVPCAQCGLVIEEITYVTEHDATPRKMWLTVETRSSSCVRPNQ